MTVRETRPGKARGRTGCGMPRTGQEPWKAPLPRFIEQLYLERFGRERPVVVMSVEAS
jgi:hypothetical protein